MIKPPSLQSEYSLIYSGDPALDLPDDEKAREHALSVARDTGNWPLKSGEEPTVFQLKPLTGSQYDWWAGEVKRRNLVVPEAQALAVRLALRSVRNFGPHKVEHTKVDGYQLAKVETVDAIYSVPAGREVIAEIAEAVIERATTAPRPL